MSSQYTTIFQRHQVVRGNTGNDLQSVVFHVQLTFLNKNERRKLHRGNATLQISVLNGSGTTSIGLASSKLMELVEWSKRSKIIWLKQESKQ